MQWPVKGDLVIPLEQAPDDLREGMGRSYELRKKNREVLEDSSGQ